MYAGYSVLQPALAIMLNFAREKQPAIGASAGREFIRGHARGDRGTRQDLHPQVASQSLTENEDESFQWVVYWVGPLCGIGIGWKCPNGGHFWKFRFLGNAANPFVTH